MSNFARTQFPDYTPAPTKLNLTPEPPPPETNQENPQPTPQSENWQAQPPANAVVATTYQSVIVTREAIEAAFRIRNDNDQAVENPIQLPNPTQGRTL